MPFGNASRRNVALAPGVNELDVDKPEALVSPSEHSDQTDSRALRAFFVSGLLRHDFAGCR